MIRNVSKLLRKPKQKKPQLQKDHQDSKPQETLHKNFGQNVETLRSVYDHCSDVVFRPFLLFGKTRATIIYIEGLEEYVLSPLMQEKADDPQPIIEFLEHKMPVSKVKRVNMLADCIESISSGNPILLYEGESDGKTIFKRVVKKRFSILRRADR